MSGHALLSPSSAHRWLNCTKAPRLEAGLPDKGSAYAREGTIAHRACELTGKLRFKKISTETYLADMQKLRADKDWNDEMLHTAEIYADHLSERAIEYAEFPHIAFEVPVNISDYVPKAFGRCDCVMLGRDALIITDYKHGKGVPVPADKNPQLMLYALGALKKYRPVFGEAIKTVAIYIDQPRLAAYGGWHCTTETLLEWGESIKPIAQKAYAGEGEFHAGDWCRFCRANGICAAQAQQQLHSLDKWEPLDQRQNPLLSPAELGDALTRGKNLVAWYERVKENALAAILQGKKIPGYKAVEGRSTRAWIDQEYALKRLQELGVEEKLLYNHAPKSLAQIEKALGPKAFRNLAADLVCRPAGKATLADADDPREEFGGAVADFINAVGNQTVEK